MIALKTLLRNTKRKRIVLNTFLRNAKGKSYIEEVKQFYRRGAQNLNEYWTKFVKLPQCVIFKPIIYNLVQKNFDAVNSFLIFGVVYTEPSPELFTSNYYVIITQFRMFGIKDPNFFCD